MWREAFAQIATFALAAAGVDDSAIDNTVVGGVASGLTNTSSVVKDITVHGAVRSLVKRLTLEAATIGWASGTDRCAGAVGAMISGLAIIEARDSASFTDSARTAFADGALGKAGGPGQQWLGTLDKESTLLADLTAILGYRIASAFVTPTIEDRDLPARLLGVALTVVEFAAQIGAAGTDVLWGGAPTTLTGSLPTDCAIGPAAIGPAAIAPATASASQQ